MKKLTTELTSLLLPVKVRFANMRINKMNNVYFPDLPGKKNKLHAKEQKKLNTRSSEREKTEEEKPVEIDWKEGLQVHYLQVNQDIQNKKEIQNKRTLALNVIDGWPYKGRARIKPIKRYDFLICETCNEDDCTKAYNEHNSKAVNEEKDKEWIYQTGKNRTPMTATEKHDEIKKQRKKQDERISKQHTEEKVIRPLTLKKIFSRERNI